MSRYIDFFGRVWIIQSHAIDAYVAWRHLDGSIPDDQRYKYIREATDRARHSKECWHRECVFDQASFQHRRRVV